MLNFFRKKPSVGTQVAFKIDGMHCTSCSMTIDDELEDADGVLRAETNYAKAKTVVTFDPTQTDAKKLKAVIESLEYSATELH